MRRRSRTALLAVALGLAAPALAARAEEPVAEQAAEETAKELMECLQKEVRAAQKAYYDDYRAAVEKAREEAAAEGREPTMPAYDMAAAIAPFVAEFEEAAARFAGTDEAVEFLVWLVFNARGEPAAEVATETLLTTHLESPAIGRFAASMPYLKDSMGADRVGEALGSIIGRNPDADVRAQALIARGEMSRPTDQDAARADYTAAAELAKDPKIAGRARGILTEMDELQIGMVAPDIEGEDLDGVAFKLSDYRGKVVVLDFWGDW